MSTDALIFLIEMLLKPEERGLFQALWENAGDRGVREMYSDWLKEHDRELSAERVLRGLDFLPWRYARQEFVQADHGVIGSGAMFAYRGGRPPGSGEIRQYDNYPGGLTQATLSSGDLRVEVPQPTNNPER